MRYITDGIRRTSKEKLYNELGFETLKKKLVHGTVLFLKDFLIQMFKVPIQYYFHFCEYKKGMKH